MILVLLGISVIIFFLTRIATHNLSVAKCVADRLFVMY